MLTVKKGRDKIKSMARYILTLVASKVRVYRHNYSERVGRHVLLRQMLQDIRRLIGIKVLTYPSECLLSMSLFRVALRHCLPCH